METLRTVLLIATTVVVGLMGGVFFLYSNTIMPGLGNAEDRTFVGAFQAIDTRIINPAFMFLFFGGVVLSGVTVFVHLDDQFRSSLPWLVTALVLYVVVFILTVAINVPLNNYIKSAGDPATIEVAQVRTRFNEKRWIRSSQEAGMGQRRGGRIVQSIRLVPEGCCSNAHVLGEGPMPSLEQIRPYDIPGPIALNRKSRYRLPRPPCRHPTGRFVVASIRTPAASQAACRASGRGRPCSPTHNAP